MIKILILYSSLGAGHFSAAKALREAFSRCEGVTAIIEDALEYASSVYRSTVKETYEGLSEQAPRLYQLYYEKSDLEELDELLESNRFVARMEQIFFLKLAKMVQDVNPDILISVQQIPARFLQVLKEAGKLSQPHFVVVTDLIAHSSWINVGVDGYFVPTELTRELLGGKGVDTRIVHVTGIPVKLETGEPKDRETIRRRRKFPMRGPLITFFGGGLKLGRARRVVESILRSVKTGCLVIASGRNKELHDELLDLDSPHNLTIRRLGMIDYVDDLVAASDVVVTKAGGLIVSEILARGTPMVIVDPIPGQEEWNADGVTACGAGLQVRMPEMVGTALQLLLADPERLAAMAQLARATGQPQAALKVAATILEQWAEKTNAPLAVLP